MHTLRADVSLRLPARKTQAMPDARRATSPRRAAPADQLRLEVYHSAQPGRRVLVSISGAATLDALHDAINLRLGMRPERCCLGESEAAVLAVGDLRDGDALRVVEPALPEDMAGSSENGPPRWRKIVRLLLTAFIFVIMFETFQRWVVRPLFRPDLSNSIRGERIPVGEF